jgi:hypothetical protein
MKHQGYILEANQDPVTHAFEHSTKLDEFLLCKKLGHLYIVGYMALLLKTRRAAI